jgi:hypothetical protein
MLVYGVFNALQPATAVEVDGGAVTLVLSRRGRHGRVQFAWDEIGSVRQSVVHGFRERTPVLEIKVRAAKTALA